jgi:hypothetical protein
MEKMEKPAWVTSGIWDFNNINSNSPVFNATFNMFILNGTAAHKHGTMTDLKISGNLTTAMLCYLQWYNHCITKESIRYITIKLMGDSAVSIWVVPSKTENHFGNTTYLTYVKLQYYYRSILL